MAIAIIAHHPETRLGDWAKVKALLISTYHIEEEEPNLNNVFDDLLAQGLNTDKPDMFLNSFTNIMASLHERESMKIMLLLKAVPTHIHEKVIMSYNEEIKTLDEAIQCIHEQTKSQ
ncbi:hypothetical protein EV182_007199 [Spiromyces aspiralis]|uniref:Uncharacterized protein n=1 Tax=Spiromyces aspiralis TaxID=68401 RepID=A0ACC1HNH8_9FUNG|nr:hypothetical protein EV182_007199 [Spiromyces aspiralis]